MISPAATTAAPTAAIAASPVVRAAGGAVPYADVCDDAGASPLDLRRTEILAGAETVRFTAVGCAAWDDTALDGGELRWALRAEASGAATAVAVLRRDGKLAAEVRTVAGDGTETVVATAPAERVGDRGVTARVPAGMVPAAFDFALDLHQGTAAVDHLPETPAGEPLLPFPDPCADVASHAVVTAAPGRHADVVAAARAAGLTVVTDLAPLGVVEVAGPAAAAPERLARLPGVASVTRPALVRRAQATPDDPWYPQQWSLPHIRVPVAWRARTASGLSVAVVDDGIDAARADLAGRVAAGRDTRFHRPLPAGASSDRGGHGTAVAGLVASATGNATDIAGIDRGATVVPYRVFDAGGCAAEPHVAAAIVHAADTGVAVVNLSLGSPEDPGTILRDAVRYAVERGAVIVASVGNRTGEASDTVYPAAYPEVVGVGATTRGGTLASYSNTGRAVHVVAPGGNGSRSPAEDLVTLGERGEVVAKAGTSFAAALVSGAVLLYRSVAPHAAPATVAAALARSATDLGDPGHDLTYGHGIVDVARLLLQAGIDTACPPGEVPPAGFDDVAPSSPHAGSIDCAVWRGIARGTGPASYAPSRPVTRAQLATFVAAALEDAGVVLAVTRDHFGDDDASPHERAINQLAEAGIVAGKSPGRFAPDEPATRAQMASYLTRAYERLTGAPAPADPHGFVDVAGDVHRDAIAKAVAAGLVRGRSATRYDPGADVLRDQMASFVVNLVGAAHRDGAVAPPA